MHENVNDQDVYHLANRMARWLRVKDGTHVLLTNKSELGTFAIPERGTNFNTGYGYGEHVHHDYKHTDFYEQNDLPYLKKPSEIRDDAK